MPAAIVTSTAVCSCMGARDAPRTAMLFRVPTSVIGIVLLYDEIICWCKAAISDADQWKISRITTAGKTEPAAAGMCHVILSGRQLSIALPPIGHRRALRPVRGVSGYSQAVNHRRRD